MVLQGEGALELTPSAYAREPGVQQEPSLVRAGSVVARLLGSGVAHAFRAGEQGMALLGVGHPRPRRRVLVPALAEALLARCRRGRRLETADYWDGEELE